MSCCLPSHNYFTPTHTFPRCATRRAGVKEGALRHWREQSSKAPYYSE